MSLGDVFLLGMLISGALGYTLSGRLAALMPGWEVISWQVVLFLPFAAIATFMLWPHNLPRVPFASWAGLAYVGLVSQFSAFFVFNAGLAIGGIARVGQVMLLQPFIVVGLAAPLNHEPINLETMLFAAAVVTTVLIGQRTRVARSDARKFLRSQKSPVFAGLSEFGEAAFDSREGDSHAMFPVGDAKVKHGPTDDGLPQSG